MYPTTVLISQSSVFAVQQNSPVGERSSNASIDLDGIPSALHQKPIRVWTVLFAAS